MSNSPGKHSQTQKNQTQKSLVMTLIGKDRPGLVQSLSTVVEDHGGSWQASRMVHLDGEFAGLLSIEAPESQIDALESALGRLEGVSVTVNRASEDQPTSGGVTQQLEIVGQDRPGIVRRVTERIAALNLNIEELESEVASAPMSAELHFKATAILRATNHEAFTTLRERLEELGADLMVDLKDID